MTQTTTTPDVPAWINLDAVIPAEIQAEIAEVTAELNAIEPQLEALGRRAYEVHSRAEDAMAARPELDGMMPAMDAVNVSDGVATLLTVLSGDSALFDAALRVGGHLHAWTACQATTPTWLIEAKGPEADKLRM